MQYIAIFGDDSSTFSNNFGYLGSFSDKLSQPRIIYPGAHPRTYGVL